MTKKFKIILMLTMSLCLFTGCQGDSTDEKPVKKEIKTEVASKKVLEAAEGSGVFTSWNEFVIYAKSNSIKSPTHIIKYDTSVEKVSDKIDLEKSVLSLSKWENRILATVADRIVENKIDQTYFVLEPKKLKLVPYNLMEAQQYPGDLIFYGKHMLLVNEHVDYLAKNNLSYDIYIIEDNKNVLLAENCDFYNIVNGQVIYKDHNNNLYCVDLKDKTKPNVYALGQNFYGAYIYENYMFIDTEKGLELIKDGERQVIDQENGRIKTSHMLQHQGKIYYFGSDSLNEIDLETMKIKPIIATKDGKSLDLLGDHIYYTDMDSKTNELKYFQVKIDGTEQKQF